MNQRTRDILTIGATYAIIGGLVLVGLVVGVVALRRMLGL